MELLPNEMLYMITRYLNNKDLVSLLVVCKKFGNNSYIQKEVRSRLEQLDWKNISHENTWNEILVDKYYDYFYLHSLFMNKHFSESFLRRNIHRLDWDLVSYTQVLSESFIREFQDRVNWKYISRWQKLSESFMEEFNDKVNLHRISMYQKISKEFVQKYRDKIGWNGLIKFNIKSES
jgi:hypothetical protein